MSAVEAITTTQKTTTAPPPPALGGPTAEQDAAAKAAETRLAQLLALGDVSQANAATAIYGDSGSGKTSLCATAAEYAWNRYHRVTRYYSADPGGFGNKVLRLIRLGIVQVWNPTNHIEPFETMEDASLGYWPEKIIDTFTGYADPEVRLIAPQQTRWNVYCPNGHVAKIVTNRLQLNGFSIQCPTCKVVTTVQNWSRVEEQTVRAPGVRHVGLYVYDSATSLQDWAMQDMAFRAARGEVGGEGSALGKEGKIVSGRYVFGANNRAHYGFAQNRMQSWIKNSRTIAGQVLPPLWTFLELRSTDDAKGVPIFGPKIAGNAKTSDIPAWVGNCLHAAKEENDRGKMEYRLWLTTHIDPGSTIPHLAKTRAEPGTLDDFLADKEGEVEFTRFSLGYFFSQLETALESGTRRDAMDFPDAPIFIGLEQGTEEIIGTKDLSGHETGIRTGPGRPTPPRAPAPAGQVAAAGAPVAASVAPAAIPPATNRPPVAGARVAVAGQVKPAMVAKPAAPAAPAAVVAAPAPAADAPAPVQTPLPQPMTITATEPAAAPVAQAQVAQTVAPTAGPVAAPVRPPMAPAVAGRPVPPAGRRK